MCRPWTGTPRGAMVCCSADGCPRHLGCSVSPTFRAVNGALWDGRFCREAQAKRKSCEKAGDTCSFHGTSPGADGPRLPAGTVPSTAAGLHGKSSLVNGCNAAKGSRQPGRVPWEDAMAPEAGLPWCVRWRCVSLPGGRWAQGEFGPQGLESPCVWPRWRWRTCSWSDRGGRGGTLRAPPPTCTRRCVEQPTWN